MKMIEEPMHFLQYSFVKKLLMIKK